MLVSSSAFYRDFDYDLAMATKGKKVDYVEDYTDAWSQYMLGLAHRLNFMRFEKKLLTNTWNVLTLDAKGKTLLVVPLTGTWAVIWKKFVTSYRSKKLTAVLVRPNGMFYTWSGTYVSRQSIQMDACRALALW